MATYSWEYLLDPNNFLLITIASGTILYGSRRSNSFFLHFKDSLELEKSTVKTRTAILMPIIGSIMLVLLFFFLDWMMYLLIVIMSISSLSAFGFIIYPLFDWIFNRFGGVLQKSWEVRWIGPITISGIASFFASLGVVIAWLVTFSFVLTDVLAISLAISALSFVRLPNMKISLIILILFFLYDIFWVFISPLIFKQSVMVKVATSLPNLPMVIIIPRILHEGWSLLGVGDIVLPGLWICFLNGFDSENGTPFKCGYFLISWIGYIFGFIMTLCMLLVMQQGQPALLYLVPFTILPVVFFGWKRKELKKLWKGDTMSDIHSQSFTLEDNLDNPNTGLLSQEETKEV